MYKKGILRIKAISQIFIVLLATFYVSMLAVDVRAINACCEQTITGDYCQYTDEENCNLNVRQGNAVASCEQTSYCQLGCCSGLENGCSSSVSKATCEAKGGSFSTDASCSSIPECKQVCCQLGNECQLSTENACNNLADSLGVSAQIKDATTESQCLSYCRLEESGCCASEAGCNYLQFSECSELSGAFTPGKYCSSLNECKSCQAKSYKSCIPGKDDVYYFDSCGNPEQIAEECDYASGTTCGEVSGEVACKSLDCKTTYDNPSVDYDGVSRKNGESWCSYEGATGAGRDLVGSRHYRHSCVNGEEIVEPCADFRQEYCVQGTLDLNGKEYTEAFCLQNKGDECVQDCNTGNVHDDKQCCTDNPSCFWSGSDSSGTCLPIVPEGSRFWEGQNEDICEQSDFEVTVYWEKKTVDWDCAGNCDVIKDKNFAEKFNALCVAKNDCGAYYNYLGEFSRDGFYCTSDGTCRGKKHDDRFDLANIDPNFFGTIESLKKTKAIEYSDVEITDKKVKLPTAISVMSLAFTYAQSIFSVDLNYNLEQSIYDKYGMTLGATLASIGTTILIKALIAGGPASPLGIALLAFGAFLIILSLLSKQDDKTFALSCSPWQSPSGGDDCSKCDENKLHPCSEYKCMSLGQTCEYVPENEGTSRPSCIEVDADDANSPVLSPLESKLKIKEEVNGYVLTEEPESNKRFSFGIKTNEPAQCKYSNELNNNFDEMPDFFDSNYYSINHNMTLTPLSGVKYTYYLRCKDRAGNVNLRDYSITFNAKKGPDLTPPTIEMFSPANNGFVKNGLKNLTSDIYINEPAQCRYSLTDVAYESMSNNYNCLVSEDPETSLFRCQSILKFNAPSSTYYLRCRDNSTNVNSQSFVYNLKGTQPLTIESKKPQGRTLSSNQTLELQTAGGAESGKSFCRFSPRDSPYSAMIDFFSTNSSSHKQVLALDSGTYTYFVKCQDIASNEAKTSLTFTVFVDNKGPQVKRLFTDSSQLTLILDESAKCEYSQSKFTFGTGKNMPQDNSAIHTASLLSSYYIECRDISGNALSLKVIV